MHCLTVVAVTNIPQKRRTGQCHFDGAAIACKFNCVHAFTYSDPKPNAAAVPRGNGASPLRVGTSGLLGDRHNLLFAPSTP
jgi:hypothetical protein